MNYYKVITVNDKKSFEQELNKAKAEGYTIADDGVHVNTNGVGLNLIYTAIMCLDQQN